MLLAVPGLSVVPCLGLQLALPITFKILDRSKSLETLWSRLGFYVPALHEFTPSLVLVWNDSECQSH